MSKVSVFLGGPIQYIMQRSEETNSKRKEIIQTLVDILNNNNIQVFSAHIEEKFGKDVPVYRNIYQRDYQWMQQCEVFCLMMFSEKYGYMRSDGSYIELGWALVMGKPIILLMESEALSETSALFQGCVIEKGIKIASIDSILENPDIFSCIVQEVLAK